MKKISILGSTGSIGTQSLEVVSQHRDLQVVSMCCNSRIALFEKQVRLFKPAFACVYDESKYLELKSRLSDTKVKISTKMSGLLEMLSEDNSDLVVTAMSGMIGIEPTLKAIEMGKDIALANKETLVSAGDIVMKAAHNRGVKIIPVDSEHSAIYQCLYCRDNKEIEKILLTASGGPFRTKSLEELKDVTKIQALKHPNWSMGQKITIDSATMVNKGLEVIEATHLFDIDASKIEVVVHPQSIIHSMVEFKDGAVLAQLGASSMKVPIQYAIYDGDRRNLNVDRVDFFKLKHLDFEKPDFRRFKGLSLAFKALKVGGSMPAVFNAINELCVERFLQDKIGFLDIADSIEKIMNKHKAIVNPSISDIFNIIDWVKEEFNNI